MLSGSRTAICVLMNVTVPGWYFSGNRFGIQLGIHLLAAGSTRAGLQAASRLAAVGASVGTCHPLHWTRRCGRHRVRVEYRGDGLDAVDEARSRAYHYAVGIYRPHLRARQCPRDQLCLIDCARQMKSARCDHNMVWGRFGDNGPARLDRWSTRRGPDWLSPGRADEIRYPMPRGEGWIHPFDHRDPRTSPPRNRRRSTGQPGAQVADQARGTLCCPGALANGQNRVKHLIERMRVKRQHVGLASQVVQCILDVTGWQSAHPAQVLGQDQVGLQRRQSLRPQGIEVSTGR